MMNDAGLTDAEGMAEGNVVSWQYWNYTVFKHILISFFFYTAGALSDVNSIYNDPHQYDGDMDDTSMSSRASSRIFDSDAIISFDQINAYYESEYDNYRPGVVASDGFDTEPLSDVDFDGIDGINLQNIRTMSESITRNFGQSRNETDVDSDVWYWVKSLMEDYCIETTVWKQLTSEPDLKLYPWGIPNISLCWWEFYCKMKQWLDSSLASTWCVWHQRGLEIRGVACHLNTLCMLPVIMHV